MERDALQCVYYVENLSSFQVRILMRSYMMKVYFHPRFYDVYTSDPAAEAGRMEAVVEEVEPYFELVTCS